MNEEWRDIKGYEGLYQVSDLGNVKNTITGRKLVPFKNTRGYLQIFLFKDKKKKSFLVHRLVLENFNPIEDMDLKTSSGGYVIQGDHINNIKSDNRLKNLQWLTGSKNKKKEIQRNRFKRNLLKSIKGE